MNRYIHRQMHAWNYECMNGEMDAFINGSMDGRIVVRSMKWQVDKWIDEMTTPEKKGL